MEASLRAPAPVVFAALSALAALAAPIGRALAEPRARPSYLQPFVERATGASVVRVSDDAGRAIAGLDGGVWGRDARHVYSKQQPWSADGKWLALQNRKGGSPKIVLLDASTLRPVASACGTLPLYDWRWHPDPARAHTIVDVDESGRELRWFDVETCAKTRSWTLPIEADYGIGSGEGNLSADGRFVAIASKTEVVIVDMDPKPPYDAWPARRIGPVTTLPPCGLAEGCKIGNVSISPSGRYLDVKYAGKGDLRDAHRIFEVDAKTLAIRPHTMAAGALRCGAQATDVDGWIFPLKHADMALDPFDGDEDVIVGGRSCPGAKMGRVVKVRLRDGKVTSLTDPKREASVFHVSTRNVARPGWAYVTYFPGPGKRFDDEIVAVKLDGSATTERWASTHSAAKGCYRCEPHAVPSPDGTRVAFASNWAADCGPGCGDAEEIALYVVRRGAAPKGSPPPRR
jgi:hypothetical protein